MEHQGWGNLWAELKPRLRAAGRGMRGSLCAPQKPSAPQLPVLARGQGTDVRSGGPRCCSGDQQTPWWICQCMGDPGSGSSSWPCGSELQHGPSWGFGVLGTSLLGWFAARSDRAWFKSQTKPEVGGGCGGSRVMDVMGAGRWLCPCHLRGQVGDVSKPPRSPEIG